MEERGMGRGRRKKRKERDEEWEEREGMEKPCQTHSAGWIQLSNPE